MYDENFNIYKAFTIAEEKLYLSCSAADSEGKGLRKSILINKIRRIFENLKEESDLSNKNEKFLTANTTFDMLLTNLRKGLNPDKDIKVIVEFFGKQRFLWE